MFDKYTKRIYTGIVGFCIYFTLVFAIFAQSTGIPLGVNVFKDEQGKVKTSFAIWSPDTSDVKLWLDGETLETKDIQNNEDQAGGDHVYYVNIDGDYNLKPYHFIIKGKSTHDPYARMVDLNYTKPDYNKNDIVIDSGLIKNSENRLNVPKLDNLTDAIVCEAMIRDFSISPNSGIDDGLKSTFSGMIQSGTTYKDFVTGKTYSTGFDYLKNLGFTHIQIMPMYQFGSCSIEEVLKESQLL